MALDRSLLARAAALRELDEEVTRTARTTEHAAVAKRYATEHQALVGPYHEALERLRLRDVSDLDFVLDYLETAPEFLGSTYLGARIIRAIAKLEPALLDRPRLDELLARLAAGPRSEQQRAAASLMQRLAAGSPRRAPRVLERKHKHTEHTASELEDEAPHVIPVKGRAI